MHRLGELPFGSRNSRSYAKSPNILTYNFHDVVYIPCPINPLATPQKSPPTYPSPTAMPLRKIGQNAIPNPGQP